jgi:cytidylate kinase
MSPATLDVITIDGPAGSGKSSVGKRIAQLLDWSYLDTGSQYRSVGVLCQEQGFDLNDELACAVVAREFVAGHVIPAPGKIWYQGSDLSAVIRTPEASMGASLVARHPLVREVLVEAQQIFTAAQQCVVEGRDAGTTICPTAIVKIHLTAREEVRAQRREESALEAIIRRDRIDSTRATSPLEIAKDANVIDSSDITIDEIANQVCQLYRDRSTAP